MVDLNDAGSRLATFRAGPTPPFESIRGRAARTAQRHRRRTVGVVVATLAVVVAGGLSVAVIAGRGGRAQRVTVGSTAPTSAKQSPGWTATPIRSGPLVSLSCPSATFCGAVGENLATRTVSAYIYSNGQWSAGHEVDSHTFQAAVSCASTTFCVIVDSLPSAAPTGDDGGYAYVYRNGRWSAGRKIDPFKELSAVSCTSPGTCTAVDYGSHRAFRYRGGRWWGPVPLGTRSNPVSISCPSATFCVAADQAVAVRGDDFSTFAYGRWSSRRAVPVAVGGLLASVSCPTESSCAAIDENGTAYRLRDDLWTDGRSVTLDGTAISCPTSTFCVAVGGSDENTYTGRGWTGRTMVDPGGGLNAVSCPTAKFCMAVGQAPSRTGNLTVGFATKITLR